MEGHTSYDSRHIVEREEETRESEFRAIEAAFDSGNPIPKRRSKLDTKFRNSESQEGEEI